MVVKGGKTEDGGWFDMAATSSRWLSEKETVRPYGVSHSQLAYS